MTYGEGGWRMGAWTGGLAGGRTADDHDDCDDLDDVGDDVLDYFILLYTN